MKRGNAAYEKEFSDNDHIDLADKLSRVKGMVVLSGYNSDLYNELYKGWDKIERNAFADGGGKRVECLWISPNCKLKK